MRKEVTMYSTPLAAGRPAGALHNAYTRTSSQNAA